MAAIVAADAGKTIFQDSTIQVAVDHLPEIGAKKAVGALESFLIDLFENFEMILHALIVVGVLRIALLVDGFRHRQAAFRT